MYSWRRPKKMFPREESALLCSVLTFFLSRVGFFLSFFLSSFLIKKKIREKKKGRRQAPFSPRSWLGLLFIAKMHNDRLSFSQWTHTTRHDAAAAGGWRAAGGRRHPCTTAQQTIQRQKTMESQQMLIRVFALYKRRRKEKKKAAFSSPRQDERERVWRSLRHNIPSLPPPPHVCVCVRVRAKTHYHHRQFSLSSLLSSLSHTHIGLLFRPVPNNDSQSVKTHTHDADDAAFFLFMVWLSEARQSERCRSRGHSFMWT